MPYVPQADRPELDKAVELLAQEVASKITNNLSLIDVYAGIFMEISAALPVLVRAGSIAKDKSEMDYQKKHLPDTVASNLVKAIYDAGAEHGYEGAHLGELNYAITRFIQRVPQIKVEQGEWKEEFRYWIYAATVDALVYAARNAIVSTGIGGVYEDIKDEYKWRANRSYEIWQITNPKNGDCFDIPYLTKPVEAVDERGNFLGYVDIPTKRGINLDGYQLVLRKK